MATTKVPEVRDITRIERIGKYPYLHLDPDSLAFYTCNLLLNGPCAPVPWRVQVWPGLRFLFQIFLSITYSFLFVFLGAHSHIRGLGLDDALEPRQVASHVAIWSIYTSKPKLFYIWHKTILYSFV